MGNQIFLVNKKQRTVYLFWKKSYIDIKFREFYKDYYNFYKFKKFVLNDPKFQHLKEYFTDKFNKLEDFLFDKINLNDKIFHHKLKEDIIVVYENFLDGESEFDEIIEECVIVESIYSDDEQVISRLFKNRCDD